jgi:hypothetical protein
LAALDANSGVLEAWNPNANGFSHALAISGDTVYAGGNFSSIGGQPSGGIAAIPAVLPMATINAATAITTTQAALHGTITSTVPVTVSFQITANDGLYSTNQTVPAANTAVSGAGVVVSATANGHA